MTTTTTAAQKRRRLVGVSTKMYFSAQRTRQYVGEVLGQLAAAGGADGADGADGVDIFIIPDVITLASVVGQVRSSGVPVLVGAQDAFWEDAGSYTGSVSPAVLAEVGCRMVEVGHAERRRLFGETDADTASKAAAAARNGLTPLVCVGEASRGAVSMAAGQCASQVQRVMAAVPAAAEVILAYEPVWAIGAAEPAAPEHVAAVVAALRELPCVADRDGPVRIIYGGSAGPGLFQQLKHSVDGLFLGRFAHDPDAFVKTIHEVAAA
ncbi:hypothetical protein KVR01_001461 [Diaporthe batatas]|uniref:uncharacterized protein n=1 Tax=Diaporthe batatas TaxID=748121 RepID=UPI001D04DBDA|nr:uncharacterized protein KVR01_001461 [Diaporthe batatas]KAG8168712.1 hypothetical protein KVR01_001461 [Diaporthe batatas]